MHVREHLATLPASTGHGRRVNRLLSIQPNTFHADFATYAEIELVERSCRGHAHEEELGSFVSKTGREFVRGLDIIEKTRQAAAAFIAGGQFNVDKNQCNHFFWIFLSLSRGVCVRNLVGL